MQITTNIKCKIQFKIKIATKPDKTLCGHPKIEKRFKVVLFDIIFTHDNVCTS